MIHILQICSPYKKAKMISFNLCSKRNCKNNKIMLLNIFICDLYLTLMANIELCLLIQALLLLLVVFSNLRQLCKATYLVVSLNQYCRIWFFMTSKFLERCLYGEFVANWYSAILQTIHYIFYSSQKTLWLSRSVKWTLKHHVRSWEKWINRVTSTLFYC